MQYIGSVKYTDGILQKKSDNLNTEALHCGVYHTVLIRSKQEFFKKTQNSSQQEGIVLIR